MPSPTITAHDSNYFEDTGIKFLFFENFLKLNERHYLGTAGKIVTVFIITGVS
jgi:hypothetical protein